MSKKNKEDIIIDMSNSGSAEDVTGSCIHVQYQNLQILLECGMQQLNSPLESYRENAKNFKFKAKELDYVFAMHLHIDHIGNLPLLYKRGCEATLVVPKGSKTTMIEMLQNSAMIVNGDAEYLTKKTQKYVEPLYTLEDVYKTISHVVEYDIYQEVELSPMLQFKFISSGHIAESTSLVLKIKKNNTWKSIYYTSDLGNIKFKNYYVNNMDRIKNADLVISECTYNIKENSCSNADQRTKDLERIENVVNQYCIERKGKVLIPVFALHRGQQMATILYDLFINKKNFNVPIYMDSILLNNISEIYKKKFPKFREVMESGLIKPIDKQTRQSLMMEDSPMIILAASGMLNAGASVSWLKNMVSSSRNCVVFCGYCGEGTLGYKLKLKNQKTITIQGETFKNKIDIVKLKSFSGHIQYDDLLNYLSNINTQMVVLHHGNMMGRICFKDDLEKEYAKLCKTTTVKVANKSMKIRL